MKPSSVKPPASKQAKSTGLKESARTGGSQLNVSIAQSAGDTDQSTGSSQSFTIGDRVLVSGSKPGIIAYIGATQFAVGDWVGVELDTPSGKNDGSVNGVRYFTCKPLHGVFAKAAKLTKLSDAMTAMPQMTDSGVGSVEDESVFKAPSQPNSAGIVAGSLSSAPDVSMSEAAAAAEISSPPPITGGKNEESPLKPDVSQSKRLCKQLNKTSDQEAQPKRTVTAVKGSGLIPRSTFGSTVSLNKAPIGSSSADLNATISDSSVKHNFKVGDRVTVGSNKVGVLRYIGTTDFAKGEWAGVELDEPLGKNDGSVNGKRYFQCVPLYGLFAPIAKIGHLLVSPASSRRGSVSRIPVGPTLALARERSGSQDSLNSIGSMASSASRTRLRLGVTSLAGQTPKGRPGAGGDTNSSSALQKALKEKEEHVEQLLMERDLERSEVARSAMKVEEVETEIATITAKYNKLSMECDEQRQNMQKMKIRIDTLEKENETISSQLEEERKKVDDLQFAVEETSIDKGDLETRTERDARKLKELEQQLLAETANVKTLTQELSKLKAQHGEDVKTIALLEVKANQYNRQVEDLTMKLSDESDRSAFLESERVCHLEVQQEEMKEEIKEQTDKLTSTIEDISKELSEALAKIKFLEAEKEVAYNELQQYQQLESQKKEMEQMLITEKQKLSDAEQKLTEMKEQGNTTSALEQSKLTDLEKLNRDLQVKLDMAANREQQLSDEISRQQSKVTDLEKANSSLSADVETLHAEQTKLVEAKLLLSETVEQSDAANADLKSDLYKQLETELTKTAELAAVRRELEAEIEKITSVKNEYQSMTATKDLKICELEQEIEKIKQELEASISSLKNEHQSLNEKKDLKISELEQQALLMKQELDQINALNLKEVNFGLTAQLEQLKAIELENMKALDTERSKIVELEALKSVEIKSREDSLQGLQHNLDEAVNKLKQSESRLCEVEKLYSNSQAELDAANNAKQDLLQCFESEQVKVATLEKAVEKLAEVENSFALLTEQSEQQKIEIAKLESVVGDLNEKLQHSETVSDELSRLKAVESALRQELETERSKVTEMCETKRDMQVELEQLKITEKELLRLTDQHRNNLIELEQLRNSSTEKVGQLSADLSSYSKQLEDKDKCIMASKNQIQELTSKLVDAEKCYSEQAELLALQKAQFAELENRNLELSSKFEALQKSSSDQVAMIDLKQIKITEVEELCQRLSDQLKSIQQTADERCIEIDRLKKVNLESDNSVKQLTQEHGELKIALEAKVVEIESLQKDHVAFKEDSSHREAEVKQMLESERENKSKLEGYIEDLKTELEAVKAERSHQLEAIQLEQKKLLEIEEKERLLSEENEKIKIELKDAEELKLKILELERSHSEKAQAAEKTCCDLTQAVDEYRQRCADLATKLDQKSSELAASKASETELGRMRQEDRMKYEELERTNKEIATKFEAVKGTETDQLKLIEIEQAKVAELERQCRQLCAEVDLSKKSVDESKSNIAALQDGNAVLAAEVEKLKADLKTLENEKQSILADHSRAVEELNSKLEEITSSKIELFNSLESEKSLTGHLTTDVETLKLQLREQETARELEKNKVLDGEEKYRQLELEFQQLREESVKEMENMKVKVDELEQRNKLLLESNSQLSSEQLRAAEEHKLKLSELNELIDALNAKLDLFASSDSELKSTIDLTSAKNNDLIKANQELLAEIERVKAELLEQTRSLDSEREQNASLKKQQAGLSAELDVLKTSLEQKSEDNVSKIVALEKCNVELTAQVTLLKADKQAVEDESAKKYSELNQVLLLEQGKVSQLAQTVEQDKAKIGDLTQTLEQSQAKIGELTQITEQDKTEIDQLTEAVELGQAKISELNQMIGGDQAKITELSEEIRQNLVKIDELTGLVEEGKHKIGELTDIVERGQVKIADLTQVVEQQQSEIKELNEMNVALRNKIDSAMSTETEKSELLTSEQLRRSELEKSNSDLQLKIKQIESECVEHKQNADIGQQKIIAQEQEILALRKANTALLNENSAVREKLEMDDKQLKQLNQELNDRLQQVCEENRQNIVTSEDYKEQVSRLKVSVEQLEAELVQSKTSVAETLSQTSAELVAALEAEKLKFSNLEQSVDVLKSEKDRLSCVEVELRDELTAKGVKLEQFDKMAVELEQSQVLIQQLRTEVEVEQQRASELQMACKKLESEHGLASADVQDKIILLGAEKAELQTEVDDLRIRLQQAECNLLEQKRSMQSVVDSNVSELRQKDSRLEQMKTEVTQLTKDLAVKSDQLASVQRDNGALKSKVSLLEKNGQGANGVGDSETASETRAEVDFLNSVIVELQRKNESLQKQLEASLTMSAPTSSHKGSESPTVSRAVAPRLFCDICDVFDLHDTDDCPRQAMTSDSPTPQCHGDFNQVRPYCDNCEVFGHWTSDCDDDQTY